MYAASLPQAQGGTCKNKEGKKMANQCSAIFAVCFSFCYKTVPKKVQQSHPCSFQKALVSAFFSTDPNTAAHRLLKELSKRFFFIHELSRM